MAPRASTLPGPATPASITTIIHDTSTKPKYPSLFLLILPLVDPWLDSDCIHQVSLIDPDLLAVEKRCYLSIPIMPPCEPTRKYKRRMRGFGHAKMGLSTSHDRPGYEIIVHHLWEFIANDDRANLVQSDNIFSEYAQLRLSAYQNRHAILQLQHRHPSLDDTSSMWRGPSILRFPLQ